MQPNEDLILKVSRFRTFNCPFSEDYAQDTKIEIFNNLHTFKPDKFKDPRGWIGTVTHHHVAALFKRDSRLLFTDNRNPVDLESVGMVHEDYLNDIEKTIIEEDFTFENHIYRESISKALSLLNPYFRDAFLLQMGGFKLWQIRDIQYQEGMLANCKQETIKSCLRLSKLRLQELLKPDGTFRYK